MRAIPDGRSRRDCEHRAHAGVIELDRLTKRYGRAR
jgi:hypothetical protein